ncbi:hypothetical protein AMATHDRAFT_6436 [Amanita thiersii Skay4041]|uniref:Uncharacterized protein n=1 Tax=Amanita thiersii Skay4041 TaxID=703135 RepID=A0A2A9NCG0_9AGAR|nr:hypothetical protein AMATHDRAFT_6436 [Amanita thiersii Skay4041]
MPGHRRSPLPPAHIPTSSSSTTTETPSQPIQPLRRSPRLIDSARSPYPLNSSERSASRALKRQRVQSDAPINHQIPSNPPPTKRRRQPPRVDPVASSSSTSSEEDERASRATRVNSSSKRKRKENTTTLLETQTKRLRTRASVQTSKQQPASRTSSRPRSIPHPTHSRLTRSSTHAKASLKSQPAPSSPTNVLVAVASRRSSPEPLSPSATLAAVTPVKPAIASPPPSPSSAFKVLATSPQRAALDIIDLGPTVLSTPKPDSLRLSPLSPLTPLPSPYTDDKDYSLKIDVSPSSPTSPTPFTLVPIPVPTSPTSVPASSQASAPSVPPSPTSPFSLPPALDILFDSSRIPNPWPEESLPSPSHPPTSESHEEQSSPSVSMATSAPEVCSSESMLVDSALATIPNSNTVHVTLSDSEVQPVHPQGSLMESTPEQVQQSLPLQHQQQGQQLAASESIIGPTCQTGDQVSSFVYSSQSQLQPPPQQLQQQQQIQQQVQQQVGSYGWYDPSVPEPRPAILHWEEPPRVDLVKSMWKFACKYRVWEMYTPHIIRSVVAQEANDYYSVHGYPSGYFKAKGQRIRKGGGGKRKRRRKEGGEERAGEKGCEASETTVAHDMGSSSAGPTSESEDKGKEKESEDASCPPSAFPAADKGPVEGEQTDADGEREKFLDEEYYDWEIRSDDEDEDTFYYDEYDEDEDDMDDMDESDSEYEEEEYMEIEEEASGDAIKGIRGDSVELKPVQEIVSRDVIRQTDDEVPKFVNTDEDDPSFNAELTTSLCASSSSPSAPVSPTNEVRTIFRDGQQLSQVSPQPASPTLPSPQGVQSCGSSRGETLMSAFYCPPPQAVHSQMGELSAHQPQPQPPQQQQQQQQPHPHLAQHPSPLPIDSASFRPPTPAPPQSPDLGSTASMMVDAAAPLSPIPSTPTQLHFPQQPQQMQQQSFTATENSSPLLSGSSIGASTSSSPMVAPLSAIPVHLNMSLSNVPPAPPVLPLPPPRLASVQVRPLKWADIGKDSLLGKGTPVDKGRTLQWGNPGDWARGGNRWKGKGKAVDAELEMFVDMGMGMDVDRCPEQVRVHEGKESSGSEDGKRDGKDGGSDTMATTTATFDHDQLIWDAFLATLQADAGVGPCDERKLGSSSLSSSSTQVHGGAGAGDVLNASSSAVAAGGSGTVDTEHGLGEGVTAKNEESSGHVQTTGTLMAGSVTAPTPTGTAATAMNVFGMGFGLGLGMGVGFVGGSVNLNHLAALGFGASGGVTDFGGIGSGVVMNSSTSSIGWFGNSNSASSGSIAGTPVSVTSSPLQTSRSPSPATSGSSGAGSASSQGTQVSLNVVANVGSNTMTQGVHNHHYECLSAMGGGNSGVQSYFGGMSMPSIAVPMPMSVPMPMPLPVPMSMMGMPLPTIPMSMSMPLPSGPMSTQMPVPVSMGVGGGMPGTCHSEAAAEQGGGAGSSRSGSGSPSSSSSSSPSSSPTAAGGGGTSALSFALG